MTNLSNIPAGPHYAIVTEVSVSIPGDECWVPMAGVCARSYTETYIQYEAFTDRAEWEARITTLTNKSYGSRAFRAFHVNPASITTTIKVEVGLPKPWEDRVV